MSREIKRVPLDFDWPLNEPWEGYLLPQRLNEAPCGTSGTGLVAYGTRYPPDGVSTLHWTTPHRSTTVFPSVGELVNIHGHGGRTEVQWEDYVEHATLMPGGGMQVRPVDPDGEWVKDQLDAGHRVYRRRVYVVEDWTEVDGRAHGPNEGER